MNFYYQSLCVYFLLIYFNFYFNGNCINSVWQYLPFSHNFMSYFLQFHVILNHITWWFIVRISNHRPIFNTKKSNLTPSIAYLCHKNNQWARHVFLYFFLTWRSSYFLPSTPCPTVMGRKRVPATWRCCITVERHATRYLSRYTFILLMCLLALRIPTIRGHRVVKLQMRCCFDVGDI